MSAVGEATRSKQPDGLLASLREWTGLPMKSIPFVALVGLAVAMASVPQFFRLLSRRYGDDESWAGSVLNETLKLLSKSSHAMADWVAGPAISNNLSVITQAALISVVCLLPAALIRSARESTWMPAVLTASGIVAGLVALPLTIWLTIGVWYLYRLAVWLYHVAHEVAIWLAGVLHWLAPFLGLVLWLVVVVGVIGWGVYLLIQAGNLTRALVAAAAVVAAMAWFTNLLDPVIAWLKDALRPVLAFIGMLLEWLGVALAYVVTFLVYAGIVLAVVGLVIAVFGTIGRVTVLSVTGAWQSGGGAQRVTDLSAGVGLTLGTVVLAAAMERSPGDFGPWLEQTWSTTPVLGFLPAPVGLIDLLVPDMAEHFLTTYFTGFYPAIDLLLLLLVCLIGVLSLSLRSGPWSHNDGKQFRIAFPVLTAVGLGLVFALPMVLMAIWVQNQDS